MGRLGAGVGTESYDEFLDSLKKIGIDISNESELRERLAEARTWRYAFTTLASNGRSLGIRFQDRNAGSNMAAVRGALARFAFPEPAQASFAAALK